jgi:hypothetical protein
MDFLGPGILGVARYLYLRGGDEGVEVPEFRART